MTNLPVPDFTFILVADTQIDSSMVDDVISDIATDVNSIPAPYTPSFVMFAGNLTDEPDKISLSYAKRLMDDFDMPAYQAVGNLDTGTDKSYWELLFGARNYAFDQGDYHIIVLDSTRPDSLLTYGGGFLKDTVDWLTNHLTTVNTLTPLIVVTHHPFWSPMQYNPRTNLFCDVENPDDVLDQFATYNLVAVCSGHTRQSMQYTDFDGVQWIITASADANDTDNVDYSPPGYMLVEVYEGYVKAYWIPVGEVDAYYIYPKVNEVSVGPADADYIGTTSDEIQDAVDYCQGLGGGTVVIKAGTYTLLETGTYSLPVRLPNNVWLIGTDEDTCILQVEAGTTNVKAISHESLGFQNNRIESLTIDGNKDNCPDPPVSHVWFCGTFFESYQSSYSSNESQYARDIIIENVTYKNFKHTGWSHYGNRRFAVRFCTFDECGTAMTPDHPCQYGIMEGNTITNTDNGVEGADCSYNYYYNNTHTGIDMAVDMWGNYLAGAPVVGNKILYNTFDTSLATMGSYVLDLDTTPAVGDTNDFEVYGNEFIDIIHGDGCVAFDVAPPNTNVLGNNTFTDVTVATEVYGNAPSIDLTAPTAFDFSGVPTAAAATVEATGGTWQGGAPNYRFQKAEFDGDGTPTITTSSSQASATYEWTNLNPNFTYAFRVQSYASSTWQSAWTEWIYLKDELPNTKPLLLSIGNKTVRDLATLEFTISATDEDDDELTYSASNLPDDATFNPATRTFSWTPSGDEGLYEDVVFKVTDGVIESSETIDIVVTAMKVMAVWGVTSTILATEAEITRLVGVCEAEGCNVVMLQYSAESYVNFITAANASAIDTWVMISGSRIAMSWADLTTYHAAQIEILLQHNIDNPTKRIVGVFWDIEPVPSGEYSDYNTYMNAMKEVEVEKHTILTQGLTLSIYIALTDTPDGRALINQFDIVCLDSYADQLDKGTGTGLGIIGRAANAGIEVVEAEMIPFLIGIESDQLGGGDNLEWSICEEGKDGYYQLEVQADKYFTGNYTYYNGQFHSQYQRSAETWHQIISTSFEYVGQTITASVTLKNSGYYQTSSRGIVMQVKDIYGNFYEESYIRNIGAMEELPLILEFTLPGGVDLSTSEVRVIAYDIDKRGTSRDPVYDNYDDYIVSHGLPADIEDFALIGDAPSYTASVKADPDVIFDGYGLSEEQLIVLDYSVWGNILEGGEGEALEKNLSDALTIGDSITKAFAQVQSDSIAIADSINKGLGIIKSDSINITDSIGKSLNKIFSDALTIIDFKTAYLGEALSIVLHDTLVISDSIRKLFDKALSDTLTITDSIAAHLGGVLSIALHDTMTIADSLVGTIRSRILSRLPAVRTIYRRFIE